VRGRLTPILLGVALALAGLAGCGSGESLESPSGTDPLAEAGGASGGGTCARLYARGRHIVDARGREVLLRGLNMFDNLATAGRLRRAGRQGFNVVRLVSYWDRFEPRAPRGGRHRYDRRALARLDRTIDQAKDEGLYLILDPVHLFRLSPAFGGRGIPAWVYEGRGLSLEQAQDRIATDRTMHRHLDAFLRFLADRYKDEPAVVAIDPVNEPPAKDLGALVSWYDEMARAIRRGAPDMLILVEPRFGDYDVRKMPLDRIADRRNLVLSPHFYYGGNRDDGYAGSGALQGRYLFDGKTGYQPGNEENLASHLRVSLDAARALGLPVLVGEFGIGRRQDGALEYVQALTALFGRERVSWAYWIDDAEDEFGLTEPDGSFDELVAPLRRAANAGGRATPAGTPGRCPPRSSTSGSG